MQARRKPEARHTLTETEILDAALAILDAGGPESASIRRIAAAVGVAPTTVYTYFPDQAAVEHALVERLLGMVVPSARARAGGHRGTEAGVAGGRAGGPRESGDDWRVRVEALAVDLRRRLVAHPGAVPLMLGRPMNGPTALVLGEHLLSLLAAGGLEPVVAARGAHLVVVYVLGAIALEVADVPHVGALPPEPERIAARRAAMSGVTGQAFPRIAAATGVLATWVGTEQFLWGLRRLLDGLELPAARGRAPRADD